MKKVRVWTAAAALTAALGLIYSAQSGAAGDAGKDAAAAVEKIAAAIKSGDTSAAKTMAQAATKFDLEDVMDVFKVKKKGGRGWKGGKPTDGIEAKIREVARDGDKSATKNAAIYEEIAPVISAVMMIAEAKPQGGESGKKLKKNWLQFSHDAQQGAQALAKAKAPAEVKTAMTKMNNACNLCHSDFRQ
jgi:cytochrome c556